MGIKALFFIISDFVDIEDYEESRQFIVKHIYPGKSLDNLPEQLKKAIGRISKPCWIMDTPLES